MKTKILLIILSIIFQSSHGQVIKHTGQTDWIAKQGKILSNNSDVKFRVPSKTVSEQLLIMKQKKKDSIQFVRVDVDLNISKNGKWENSNDSVKTWSLRIESPNAKFLSLIFNEFEIPKGDELVIYNHSKTILMGPFTHKNNPDGGCYAIDLIEDENLTIEYHKLKRNPNNEKIKISKVIHGLSSEILSMDSYSSTSTTDCYVNATCSEGDGWENQRNGTVYVLKLGDCSTPETSGSPWSSAVLVNNTRNDNTPYLLTAEHVPDGTGSDVSLWILRFKYWVNDCNGSINTSTISYCGAQLLEEWENNVENDVAFLKMLETPDVNHDIFYCGWNNSSSTPSSSVCISHPSGGSHLMKIAKSNSVSSDGSFWWRSDWYVGGATSGSSGAPVFDQNKRIVGLHHGRYGGDCDSDSKAGKLSYCWNNPGINGNKLSKWLDPDNSGITTLDGKYRCVETDVVNRTISSDETINGCNIKVDNVTIQNNADVIIDAEGNVTIEKDFEVKLGSTLEIK